MYFISDLPDDLTVILTISDGCKI